MTKAWSRGCELLCGWGSLAVTKIRAGTASGYFSGISQLDDFEPAIKHEIAA